ncbi:RPM1-interacting protein [Musa troglodytarum]|uniref:RPM1-interacting protein n=1 Tax=Musa troglodytarum TaxID=320322 RepID=A0A9E7KCB3_9LILI|nr:RPM1-interacting protein [Musa troglodytarum]
MAHAHVPKFGDWESVGDVPYTQRFEVVRKGRSEGKAINSDDPHENPEAVHPNLEDLHPKDDRRRLTQSPLHHGAVTSKPTMVSPLHRHGYQPDSGDHRRAGRTSGGSENSIESSPRHAHYQVKAANKVGVSSSKGPSEGGHAYASNVASRSRMRAGGRGDETPEKVSSVPKFGEWDESNPSSADGYTHIFNKVREEKTGSTKATMITDDTIYVNDQDGRGRSMSCCFGWCKK